MKSVSLPSLPSLQSPAPLSSHFPICYVRLGFRRQFYSDPTCLKTLSNRQSESSWFHILSIYRCRMDGREKKVVLVRPCSRSVRDHCMAQSTYPFRPARREEMEPRKLNKCRSSRCGANPGLPHAACIQTATQQRRGGSGTSGKHVCA